MNRRLFACIIGMVAFSAILTAPALAAIATGSTLGVALSSQSPYPTSPGRILTIGVEVQNSGNDDATGMVLEIVPADPFTLLPGEDRTTSLAKVAAHDSYSVTYRLQVAADAPTGTYPVDFRIYPNSLSGSYFEHSIDVLVEGAPNIIISGIDTAPSTLEPGTTAGVLVTLQNIGTGKAGDLQLSINSSSDDIKPVLAKGSVFVGDIAPGQSKIAELGISIETTAEERTYGAGLVASFRNENGSSETKTFSIGLPVRGTIRLDVISVEPNYESKTLRIEIANKGTTEAKSLEARLFVDGKAAGIDYVSSLKANKKTTLEFPLVLSGQGELKMDYIGPGTGANTETEELSISFAPQAGDGSGTAIIVVVVIAVVGYYFWRRRRKKKRHGQ